MPPHLFHLLLPCLQCSLSLVQDRSHPLHLAHMHLPVWTHHGHHYRSVQVSLLPSHMCYLLHSQHRCLHLLQSRSLSRLWQVRVSHWTLLRPLHLVLSLLRLSLSHVFWFCSHPVSHLQARTRPRLRLSLCVSSRCSILHPHLHHVHSLPLYLCNLLGDSLHPVSHMQVDLCSPHLRYLLLPLSAGHAPLWPVLLRSLPLLVSHLFWRLS